MRVSVVLPGRSPETSFAANAQSRMAEIPEAYSDLAQAVFANFAQSREPVTYSQDVAEAIWQAANDPTSPMRLPAGADAVAWANAR